VTFRDALGLAFRNLGQAKLRTALTTLGVSIGIASLAGMVSLGVGLQDQIVGRFTRSGMFDAITVLSARDLPGGLARLGGAGRRGRGSDPAANAPRRALNDEALREISTMEHVRDVYPNFRVPVEFKYGQFSELTTAVGISMSSKGEGVFQSMPHGQFFKADADQSCMLSLEMARRIDEASPQSLVGRSATIAYAAASGSSGVPVDIAPSVQVQRVEQPCTIVGLVERESAPGIGGGPAVAALMIPLAKARAISASAVRGPQAMLRETPPAPTYPTVTVRVQGAQHTQDVEDRIKKMGFSAFSLTDALEGAKRGFLVLDIVLSLIGSIALAVSSLGIVNTMVMSILERTREIGIMKAVGGSDGDIRRIFLIEASAIGVLGGAAGVVLGWAVGRVINFGANMYIQSQGGTPGDLFSLPIWLIAGAIGFSIVVSLIAGSYPASRAAKLDPIQALRHD
jgi:putative ABC transport system permease protein